MDKSTRACSIDDCDRPMLCRGVCKKHYMRLLKWGDANHVAPRSARPNAAARRECVVEDCGTHVGTSGARGMCPTHYSRWRRSGDAGPAGRLTRARGDTCDIAGCSDSAAIRGMCRAHSTRMARTGTAYRSCLYCGTDMTAKKNARKFCSRAHAAMHARYGASRGRDAECQRCHSAFSIETVGKAGRTKRADSKMCPECRRARTTRHGWSVAALVNAHGTTDCGICGDPVDLALRAPERMRASVDHVRPFALGGSNDLSNLQLAHLHCNHVKGARVTR